MTQRQALAEARRRWGHQGAVNLQAKLGKVSSWRCQVGYRRRLSIGGDNFFMQGRGETWAAAFADAEMRRARYDAEIQAAEAKGS